MSEEYRISAVIPTYNRRELLVRAINSAMEQSYPLNEIIVVDDHSDFSTKDFLEGKYGDHIRVIENLKKIGASESRNIGAKSASGTYIAFLDSDDFWDPKKLEKQVMILKEHPDVGLVYCDQWVVDKDGEPRESGKELIDRDILDRLLEWWTAPNTSTLVFRQSVFQDLGGFDTKLTSCQDHDLWFRIGLKHIAVAFSAERLSYFSMEGSDRISLQHSDRLDGMKAFLRKWKKEIIKLRGRMHYKWFKNNYEKRAAYPIFVLSIKKRKVGMALGIYFRYLSCNPLFYKGILIATIGKALGMMQFKKKSEHMNNIR